MTKFFEKTFFLRIDSECFKIYSKPKKLISKKNPVETLGHGLDRFFENGHVVKYPLKSKAVLTPKAWFPDFGLAPRFFSMGL